MEECWKEDMDEGAEKNALARTKEDVGNMEEDNKEGTENNNENAAEDNKQLN